MRPTILVPHDFTERSDAALARASQLARATGGTIRLVHVLVLPGMPLAAPGPAGVPFPLESEVDQARRALRDRLARHAVDGTIGVFIGSDAGDAIARLARTARVDLIVIGTRARGPIRRALLGSVADYLIRHASCPVMTLRHGAVRRAA